MEAVSPSGPFIPEIHAPATTLDQALVLSRAGLKLVILHAPVFHDDEPTTCTCERPECGKSIGKHPVLRAWQKGLVDEQAVRDGFATQRFAPNIGLVLGEQPSGFYLVSIDVDNTERFEQLQEEYGRLPPTAASESKRGKKLFFSIPTSVEHDRIGNKTALGGDSGVDVKVRGGQVVAPPSMHASGEPYIWVQTGSIAELPSAWILKLLKPLQVPSGMTGYTPELIRSDGKARRRADRYLEKAVIGEAKLVSTLKVGQRNDEFYKALCRLLPLAHGLGLPNGHSYVVRELSSAAKATGLGAKEINVTVRSAEKWLHESGAVRVLPHAVETVQNGFGGEPSTAPSKPIAPEAPNFGIAAIKLLTDRGRNAPCAENIARILEQHPAWLGGPQLDKFRMNIVWRKIPEPLRGLARGHWNDMTDADALALQGWLLSQPVELRIAAGKDTCKDGLILAGTRNHFDSLVDHVETFPRWDGIPRIDTWLTTYFGAEDTPGTRRVGRVWLVASIARVFKPGCMIDVVPILESPQRQRIGKNRGISALYGGPPYLQMPTIKKVGENIELDRTASSAWCIHDDESKLFSSKTDSTKAWITRGFDVYRVPWDRSQTTAPRRAVLVCSTNKGFYFQDDENARFFPVRCGVIDVPGIERDRMQLWAEAIVAYKDRGELWYIPQSDPIWAELRVSQQARKEEDGMSGPVEEFLLKMPPGTTPTSQVVLDSLGIKPEDRTTQISSRLHRIMHDLGWEYVVARAGDQKKVIRVWRHPM